MSRIPNAQHLRHRTRANLGTSATAIIQRWKLLQFKPGALDDRYRRSTTLVLEHFAKNAGSRCRCEPPKIWLFGSFQHEQLRCRLSICLREKPDQFGEPFHGTDISTGPECRVSGGRRCGIRDQRDAADFPCKVETYSINSKIRLRANKFAASSVREPAGAVDITSRL